MQTREGAIKIAAKKAGVSVEKYIALTSNGIKRCTKCKLWKRQTDFATDRSRHDGLKAKCQICSQGVPKSTFWCCIWGRCLQHQNAYNRSLYKSSPNFRYSRRQKTAIRRRNVDAVPPIGEEILLEDFGGLCAYCERPATTYDHVIPVSKGGRTTPDNIVPACRPCNASKGTKDVFEWMELKGISPSHQFIERIALADVWVY